MVGIRFYKYFVREQATKEELTHHYFLKYTLAFRIFSKNILIFVTNQNIMKSFIGPVTSSIGNNNYLNMNLTAHLIKIPMRTCSRYIDYINIMEAKNDCMVY